MRKMSKILFCSICPFLLMECQESENKIDSHDPIGYLGDDWVKNNATYVTFLSSKSYKERGKIKNEDILFSTSIVGALEFLHHKGKAIDKADLEELKKESVVILEMQLSEDHKSIFETNRNKLDRDKTMEYLIGDIMNDLTIEQDGATLISNGNQYENSFGTQNKIRVYFFFKGLDQNKEYRITYHDRLFGAGLINFSMNKNLEI